MASLAGAVEQPGSVTPTKSTARRRGTPAEVFNYRLPELFSGDTPEQGGPLPYPASCRPQAWAAASVVPMMLATLGLTPQGPGALPTSCATSPTPFGALRVGGLRSGAAGFSVDVDSDGQVTVRLESPSSSGS